MLQQMLDFDRRVVADIWKPRVKALDDSPGVRRSIEEIGIAKRDVLSARHDLLINVGEDDVNRNGAELAVVDRYDRAMPAAMLAARGSPRSRPQSAATRPAFAASRSAREQAGTIGQG